MSHTPNVTEGGLNGLLDHASEQAKTLARLENVAWYALDLLLEVDRIYRAYGLPSAPSDEVQRLVAGIRHLLLIAPPIEPRPPAPGAADSGELSAAPGPHVDIHIPDDISGPVADLTEGDSK